MASFTKWLGAGLGFVTGGPIGAAIGFAVGSFIDGFSEKDIIKAREEFQQRTNSNINTNPGDFEISLLVLASIVIKADKKVDRRELDFVRVQFVNMYGKERANNAFKLFNGIMKKEVSARQVCIQIRQHMTHASRLQLIHFLFGIAKSDTHVSSVEIDEIYRISSYLYINSKDFESIRAMFYRSADNDYKVLGIDKSATEREIKTAYRKMVKKYHPDKLRDLGEEHLKGAKAKFQEIQNAYENIKKEKGF